MNQVGVEEKGREVRSGRRKAAELSVFQEPDTASGAGAEEDDGGEVARAQAVAGSLGQVRSSRFIPSAMGRP